MDVSQLDESANVTAIELQKSKRVLHFSDGIMEEFSDSDPEEEAIDTTDMDVDIDVSTLPLMPRLKYQVYQAGCKFLNGIDYVGGGLATFLGITSPKFVSETDINSAYREQLEEQGEEENNSTWKQNNNYEPNTVITRYPQSQ